MTTPKPIITTTSVLGLPAEKQQLNQVSKSFSLKVTLPKKPERILLIPTIEPFHLEGVEGSTFKMDPAKKEAWLTALRSGTYQQTSGVLCAVQGEAKRYCCLGVFLEVQQIEGVEIYEDGRSVLRYPGVDENGEESHDMGSCTVLPSQFNDDLPSPIQNFLAMLNDSSHSFGAIADFIEAAL